MDKMAVFGGSFDPVHKAHIDIAREALKDFSLKKIIFVPAYAPPHKKQQFADVYERIAMLKIAVKEISNAEISFFEAERQDIVYSYETLDYFHNLYPGSEILMLIGSDSLKELDTWKNAQYLTSKYRFIVAKRPDFDIDENTKYAHRCLFMEKPMEDISSSEIRKLLKKRKEEVLKYLEPGVYDYIISNGLYK